MTKRDIIPGVYKITCLLDGRVYIGQSEDVHRRWIAHKSHSSIFEIQKLKREHGMDIFTFEILEVCEDEKERRRLELEYMKKYKSYTLDKGFNKSMEDDEYKGYLVSGREIKARREQLGITQRELANAIGVQRSRIAGYEGEQVSIPSLGAYRIAAVLGCEFEDLCKEENLRKLTNEVNEKAAQKLIRKHGREVTVELRRAKG